MYLIVTRSFPPEVGGMQSLMWGLAKEMSKNFMVKVFADHYENHKEFDKKVNFSILNKRANKVLNSVEKVIANSDYTKDLAIQNGVEQEKVIVINPGVSPAKELNKTSLTKVESLLKTKSPRLITVSRFDKRKNHEKVLMAVRNLKQIYPNIVYICIGYGEEEQNLKDLVNELNLGGQVMFFKEITDDLKNALVAKSNIFVMPSVKYKSSVEGFGIAYIEAAQYGVPSLGGSDGGAADAIQHDKTGLICDGNNLDEIYSSLNSMIENKSYPLNLIGLILLNNIKKF